MGKQSRGLFVHTAGPHTALVKASGRKNVRVIIGGRMFAIPVIQRVDYLSLALRTIEVHTTNGLTINGVAVDVTSACQVKIQGWSSPDDATATQNVQLNSSVVSSDLRLDYSAIRLAAQHFLGKSDDQIEETIKKTVAGHQRSIIGVLTVEELYRDRAAFCRRVLDLISIDMRNMGLTVVSYTVAEISDLNGYIDALGVTQTETVKREAAEGLALHQAAARSRTAQEEAGAHLEVNSQVERKIQSDKERQLKLAIAEAEVLREKAIKEKAHSISSAKQDKILYVEQQKARAAETEAELAVVEQQVSREKLIKEKVVNVEADALLYKAQKNADAVRAAAKAEAERLRLVGLAEAEAIRAKGLAEVEVLRERNRAWQESMNGGALAEKMIERLPEMAREIARPLEKTEKIVFVGGGDGGGGPSVLAKDLGRVLASVPETVNAVTGIDLREALRSLAGTQSGQAVLQGAAEGVATGFVTKDR